MKKRHIAAVVALGLAATALGIIAPTARATTPAVALNEIDCETDWVELINSASSAVDVSGWLLTDDALDRSPSRADHRYLFPANTTIAAGGRLVVEKAATGFPFGVSCGNDTIRLATGAAGTLVDEVSVPELESEGDTWGRFPDGTGPWLETAPTKGSPNEPSSAGGGPAPDAAWVFDPASVHVIDLTLPPATLDKLNTDPRTDEYQTATFNLTRADGQTFGPLTIGVRLKGNATFRTLDGKAAFKLKFNHAVGGQRFQGLKKLTLNNMVKDPSMLHETLAFRAFRAAGVPAPRTGYAYVRVNGADYGVYANIETLDDVALARHFATTQHLYEGTGVDVTPGAAGRFEVDEGRDDERSDLDALIAAANGEGPWSNTINAVADLQEMTRMWAVERYVGQWDGYSQNRNNYYFHSDASGRFRMLPWGTDLTWLGELAFDTGQSVLFAKCLESPTCSSLYREAVLSTGTAIESAGLDALAATTAQTLSPWQARDPRRETTLAQINEAVAATRRVISDRRGDAAAWAHTPQVPPAAFENAAFAGVGQRAFGEVDAKLPNGGYIKLKVNNVSVLGVAAPPLGVINSSNQRYYASTNVGGNERAANGSYATDAVTVQVVQGKVRFTQASACGPIDVVWKSAGAPKAAVRRIDHPALLLGATAQLEQQATASGVVCGVAFGTTAHFGYGVDVLVKLDAQKLMKALPLP